MKYNLNLIHHQNTLQVDHVYIRFLIFFSCDHKLFLFNKDNLEGHEEKQNITKSAQDTVSVSF